MCVGGLNKLRIVGAFMPVIAALSRWFAVRVGLEPKAAASEHANSTVLGMVCTTEPHRSAAVPCAKCTCWKYPSHAVGEQQWAWLEEELRTSSASVHIVVSSIQASAPVAASRSALSALAARWHRRVILCVYCAVT